MRYFSGAGGGPLGPRADGAVVGPLKPASVGAGAVFVFRLPKNT
jgi:hypothetical protein